MTEYHLLTKRTGIDTTWQRAPYPVETPAHAVALVNFLQSAWRVPFEWTVAQSDAGTEHG